MSLQYSKLGTHFGYSFFDWRFMRHNYQDKLHAANPAILQAVCIPMQYTHPAIDPWKDNALYKHWNWVLLIHILITNYLQVTPHSIISKIKAGELWILWVFSVASGGVLLGSPMGSAWNLSPPKRFKYINLVIVSLKWADSDMYYSIIIFWGHFMARCWLEATL